MLCSLTHVCLREQPQQLDFEGPVLRLAEHEGLLSLLLSLQGMRRARGVGVPGAASAWAGPPMQHEVYQLNSRVANTKCTEHQRCRRYMSRATGGRLSTLNKQATLVRWWRVFKAPALLRLGHAGMAHTVCTAR